MPLKRLLSLFTPDHSQKWPEQTLSPEQQQHLSNEFHAQYNQAPDNETAFILFEQGASDGVVDAIYQLGLHYENTQSQDYRLNEAEICFWRAASQGKAEAQYRLAGLYASGALGRPDSITAFHWFEKAAQNGVASAQHFLGISYEKGLGCLQNNLQAFQWTMKAAEQGITESWQRLAKMYYKGTGTEQSFATAYAWAMLAKEFNRHSYKSTQHILNSNLTSEQLSTAMVLRDELRVRHRPLVLGDTALNLFLLEGSHD